MPLLENLTTINWLAVLVAALATFMLGGLWHTALFGKLWVRLNGHTPEVIKQMQARRPPPVFFATLLVCYLLAALAAALLVVGLDLRNAGHGAGLGLVLWVLAVAIQATGHIATPRPWSAFALDAAYQLIYLPMTGAILAAWRGGSSMPSLPLPAGGAGRRVRVHPDEPGTPHRTSDQPTPHTRSRPLTTAVRIALAALSLCAAGTAAQPQRATETAEPAAPAAPARRATHCSAELGISADDLFAGFTTAEGIKKHWSVAQAETDFRLGGRIRTRYTADGKLGDPGTIVNTILAYEPGRMIAMKPTAPEGAPDHVVAFCETGWSVLRVEPLGPSRCRLTVSSMGFGESEVHDRAFEFFQRGNQWTIEKLKPMYPLPAEPAAIAPPATPDTIDLTRFVARGPIADAVTKEAVIKASPAEVFKAWTTPEGIKSFLGVPSNVELRIGGPMELYFGPNEPAGLRGSEGCQILSYLPDRMLSFSWNAPPKLAAAREKRTWIVLTFTPAVKGNTIVKLVHTGLGEGGEWPQVQAYFDKAWGSVLGALVKHFDPPSSSGPWP
jgi:uncharacterized protein YndB with AHSA1/START domain